MNAFNTVISAGGKVAHVARQGWFHATSLRYGAATGTLALMYPNFVLAQSDSGSGARLGLGRTLEAASREVGTGATQAIKVALAVVGLGMVGYAAYGLTLGRKKDEREYPIGSTMAIGIGGAVLLGVTAFAGILSATVFGSDGVDVGESFNLDEVDTGAERGSNDTGG